MSWGKKSPPSLGNKQNVHKTTCHQSVIVLRSFVAAGDSINSLCCRAAEPELAGIVQSSPRGGSRPQFKGCGADCGHSELYFCPAHSGREPQCRRLADISAPGASNPSAKRRFSERCGSHAGKYPRRGKAHCGIGQTGRNHLVCFYRSRRGLGQWRGRNAGGRGCAGDGQKPRYRF